MTPDCRRGRSHRVDGARWYVERDGRIAVRPLGGGDPLMLDVSQLEAILGRLDGGEHEVPVDGSWFITVNTRACFWLRLPTTSGQKDHGWDRALLDRRMTAAMLRAAVAANQELN